MKEKFFDLLEIEKIGSIAKIDFSSDNCPSHKLLTTHRTLDIIAFSAPTSECFKVTFYKLFDKARCNQGLPVRIEDMALTDLDLIPNEKNEVFV